MDMREDGKKLVEFLKQNFPGYHHIEASLRGRWADDNPEVYVWDVWVHFDNSNDPTKQDVRLSESDLNVLQIKLEAEVASRKVLARLVAPAF
jgi:hypothetical protein